MIKSKRKGLEPIPENFKDYLSEEQLKALPALKSKGITLFAIRRPLFLEPLVIMKLITRNKYGLLLKDGRVDYFPDVKVREQLSPVPFQPFYGLYKEIG